MTASYGRQHEYEEVLRSALQAAGNSIQPGADGLDKISHRLTVPRPLPVALAIAWLDWLYRSLTVTLPTAAEETWEALVPARKRGRHAATWIIGVAGGEGRRPVAAQGGIIRRLGRSPFGRMRPAAAMFLGIFVVAAALYVSFLVPRAITGQAISFWPFATPVTAAPPHSHYRAAGHGPSHQLGSVPLGSSSSGSTANGGNCPTPAKSAGSGPASAPPSSSPSVSSSPSPSTSTTSPSPSSSTSTSPSPSDSPSAGDGSSSPATSTTGLPSTQQTLQRANISSRGATIRRPGRRRHHKKKVRPSCSTAFLVPVAPHSGSSALSLSAAQFTVLSRDPADGSLL